MRRVTACSLMFLLLVSFAHVASAKPLGDWSNLKNFIGQEIGIERKDGFTAFGVLQSVDDSEIQVQLAGEQHLFSHDTTFQRGDIAKVWRAKLRFGQRQTGRGALIGLGVGLGTGFLTALVMAQREDSGPPHGLGLFPIMGTIAGARIGASKVKDHKKKKLIYSI